jgi:leishmanolysin
LWAGRRRFWDTKRRIEDLTEAAHSLQTAVLLSARQIRPQGLKIEDGGGEDTVRTHPEAAEVTCRVFVGDAFISNVTLAILDDTGWYEINYSIAESYPWGDGRSMGVGPITEFPSAPPKHYLCWERQWKPSCHHDFLSKAHCSPVTDFICPKTDENFRQACDWWPFVNPLNLSFRGELSVFNYLDFKVENMSE